MLPAALPSKSLADGEVGVDRGYVWAGEPETREDPSRPLCEASPASAPKSRLPLVFSSPSSWAGCRDAASRADSTLQPGQGYSLVMICGPSLNSAPSSPVQGLEWVGRCPGLLQQVT
jgi:hypothetical protein